MMNLSMSHPVPTFGDSFTITCYVCGMPSSKEWAQRARSRPSTPMKPYYPFLLQLTPTGGAILREDGSTYLCAFCHASLEAQWNMYESQQVIPPPNRKYNIQKFICAICGVETYRKRIRALPFQEFPFLEKQRQPGSITLGNNPLAVVCLDCSETLWAQSAEYDRWGLPVHKRHFNWMARPPPPEDSVEATVARLPSGETQLPRCPPIEPNLTPSKNIIVESPAAKILEAQMAAKARSKAKGDSPKLENLHHASSPTPQASRKTSLTSTTPPSMDMVTSFHSQQPPVVTVAPMSSHTTVISMRKDSLTLPSGIIAPHQGSSGIFSQPTTAVYPPAASYAPYVWGGATREANQISIEGYPYGASASETVSTGAWPWLSHPTSELIRYQTYVSSMQNRSITETSTSSSPTHTAGSSSATYNEAESRFQPSAGSSTIVSGALRDHERNTSQDHRQGIKRPGTSGSCEDLTNQRKGSPDLKTGKRSPKLPIPKEIGNKPGSSSSKPYPSHPKKIKDSPDVKPMVQGSSTRTDDTEKVPPSSPSPGASDEQEKVEVVRREYHIPKKRNWQVFMKESQSTSPTEANLPKPQNQEIPNHHPKKKKSSVSECSWGEAVPGRDAVTANEDNAASYPSTSAKLRNSESCSRAASGTAMNLSVPNDSALTIQNLKGAGATFRIEYLCQSTTTNPSVDDLAKRTSVIRCAPKVPAIVDSSSQKIKSEDEDDSMESTAESRVENEAENRENLEHPASPASPQTNKPTNAGSSNDDDDKIDDEMQGQSAEAIDDEPANRKEESDNEGKIQRQQQDSTNDTDDDIDNETKNEDLPNIKQFIKETVLELVNREKEREKVQQDSENKQKQFLNELGLITPDKKIDLEIKSIVSRHERKTLPPIQLRPDDKLERKIGEQLKELLLKVSLQDPTLFEDVPEAEKCDFMAELGMKTAEKSEKTRREIKWRVILMERMRREIRDSAARGVKHEWEKSDILKKFAKCDLDAFFNSFSYAALQASENEIEQSKAEKSESVITTGNGTEDATEDTSISGNGVCINYPKYIPSYAVTGSGGATTLVAKAETNEIKSEIAEQVSVSPEDTTMVGTNFTEPILKIPVVPPKRRLHSESSGTTGTSDTDESEPANADKTGFTLITTSPMPLSFGVPSGPYPVRIDSLIQCSTSYWQQMKQNVDDILSDLESSKEDVPLEDKTVCIDKVCKHLKSQLSDIKEIEKRFRATGKAVLNASRKKNQKKD